MDRTITKQNKIIDFFNNEVSKRIHDYCFEIKPIIEQRYKNRTFKVCKDLIKGNELLIFNPGGTGEESKIPINLNYIKCIETNNWAPNDPTRTSRINLNKDLCFSFSEMRVKKLKQSYAKEKT